VLQNANLDIVFPVPPYN